MWKDLIQLGCNKTKVCHENTGLFVQLIWTSGSGKYLLIRSTDTERHRKASSWQKGIKWLI